MRIRIDHETRYAYDRAARFIVQVLRLTPRSTEGQQVRDWRIETDVDAHLRRSEDAFGNIVHTLYTEQPTNALMVRVTGEIATVDTGGVLRGCPERLSPLVFLRDTPLTHADGPLRQLAAEVGEQGDTLARLHRLMQAINSTVAFMVGSTTADSIRVAFDGVSTNTLFNGKALSVDTAINAAAASEALDIAITKVTSLRASIGAFQSRFNFASNEIQSSIENQDAARATLLDTDVSAESTAYATAQVQLQAGIAVLAQANQLPQAYLKLLG